MKTLAAVTMLFICTLLNAQKEKSFTSIWRTVPPGELKLAESEYKSKSKVLYYISNDDQNIYIDLKIKKKSEQDLILKMGLTAWIDAGDKKSKSTGIRFPVGSQFSPGPGTPLSHANTIELIGFKDVETTRFPSDNNDNIRGAVKYDYDGNLFYYLVIPLIKLRGYNIGAGTDQIPFAIGIEYGAMPSNKGLTGVARKQYLGSEVVAVPIDPGQRTGAAAGGSRGGGSRGGSRGGSAGGGMPQGGATSRPGSNPGVTPVTIWIENIKLAVKN